MATKSILLKLVEYATKHNLLEEPFEDVLNSFYEDQELNEEYIELSIELELDL